MFNDIFIHQVLAVLSQSFSHLFMFQTFYYVIWWLDNIQLQLTLNIPKFIRELKEYSVKMKIRMNNFQI